MTRADTLMQAKVCVCGQREQDYGSPENNFTTIASFWETYLKAAHPELAQVMITNHITADDVAVMMNLLKVARMATGKAKDDNYVDACGYLACAAELATEKGGETCESEPNAGHPNLEPTGGRSAFATRTRPRGK